MFIRKKRIDKLTKKIDDLNYKLAKNNLIELSEIIGNRKELLKRNLIARYIKRDRSRNWSNNHYSNHNIYIAKNSKTKHSNNRRIYSRYSINSWKNKKMIWILYWFNEIWVLIYIYIKWRNKCSSKWKEYVIVKEGIKNGKQCKTWSCI